MNNCSYLRVVLFVSGYCTQESAGLEKTICISALQAVGTFGTTSCRVVA